MSFVNKVALVTGSGSGMGEATAILFAKEGADVVIVEINEETAKKTAEKIKKIGKTALVIKTDVSKTEDAKNAIEKTIEKFERLDVLVNNAGIAREGTLLSGRIMDNYDLIMNTNLRSVVLMTSLATRHLVKTKGCIINIASAATLTARSGSFFPAYTISKAGVDCFTRISAAELGPSGVRVNAISPGPVYTNIMANAGMTGSFEDNATFLATALGKISDATEIADLVLFLASDKAKSITGSIYAIDNGMSLV